MRRNLTTKPAGNILTKIDWTHPLTRGLVAAWVFSEDSDYLHKAAATNEVRCTYPDIVYGVPLQLIGPSDSVAAASSYGGVPGSTGMGVRFAVGINNANDRLASVTNPSPRLQVTKEVSFFWRGACYDVPHTTNFEPIFIMNYEAASETSPFSVYGVTRSNSTDLRFEHDAGGAFNSLAVTNFTTSVGKPQTVGMSRSADGAFTRVYTEGIRRTQDAVAGNMVYGTSPCIYVNGNLALGAGGGTNGTFVDVIYIWNRALSDFEQAWISQHPYEILFTPFIGRPFTLLFPQSFNQTITAGMATFDAALPKQTNRSIAAAMSTFAGALTTSNRFAQTLTAAMSTFSATLNRSTSRTFTAGMATFSATIAKFILLAQATFTAGMSTFSATLTSAATKLITLTASMTQFAGALTHRLGKAETASMSTFSATLTAIKIAGGNAKTFTAAMSTFSGALTFSGGKTLNASMSLFSATLALAVQHGGVPPVCIPAACDTLPIIISHVEVCENPGS